MKVVSWLGALALVTAGAGVAQDEEAKDELTPNQATQKRLDESEVTLNFDETPLSDVVDFMRDITGLNFALSPNVDEDVPVSLELKGIKLKNALKLAGAGCDPPLSIGLVDGVVYLYPKGEAVPTVPQKVPAGWERLQTRKVTLNFPGTAVEDVISFLGEITGLNFACSAEAAERTTNVRLRDVSLLTAIALISADAKLEWKIEDEVLQFAAKKKAE